MYPLSALSVVFEVLHEKTCHQVRHNLGCTNKEYGSQMICAICFSHMLKVGFLLTRLIYKMINNCTKLYGIFNKLEKYSVIL